MLACTLFKLRPRSNELGWIEHNDIERAAGSGHLADVRKRIGLRELDADLIEVGVLFGQLQRLCIQIDTGHVARAAQFLRLNRKAAGIATKVEDRFVLAERGQQPTVLTLITKE